MCGYYTYIEPDNTCRRERPDRHQTSEDDGEKHLKPENMKEYYFIMMKAA
jgi:hypothetical protein